MVSFPGIHVANGPQGTKSEVRNGSADRIVSELNVSGSAVAQHFLLLTS